MTTAKCVLARILAAVLLTSTAIVIPSVVAPGIAQAHIDCYDYWLNSGHNPENAVWYHCHNWQTVPGGRQDDIEVRVHICNGSGYLHGITIRHHHVSWGDDFYSVNNHVHDRGGEGC